MILLLWRRKMPPKGQKWANTANHWSKGPMAKEILATIAEKNKKYPPAFSGRTHSLQSKEQISASKKKSPKTVRGDKHHNWKGGVTSAQGKARGSLEYVLWRNAVYERDRWRCTSCGINCQKGNITAHHIESFATNPHLRFAVDNGVTLCRPCHIAVHGPHENRVSAHG